MECRLASREFFAGGMAGSHVIQVIHDLRAALWLIRTTDELHRVIMVGIPRLSRERRMVDLTGIEPVTS